MTDRPIIFSAPMILALLDGRKSQTRRVLKLPTKTHSGGPIYERADMGGWAATTMGGHGCFTIGADGNRVPAPERPAIWHQTTGVTMALPYAIGDRLYVRESIARQETDQGVGYKTYAADGSNVWPLTQWYHQRKAIPSIHMPRWASRLTLTVTDVRVQRLQEISEADAWAEGCKQGDPWDSGNGYFPVEEPSPDGKGWNGWDCARDWYADLWDSLHGPDAWDANPWVVAVSFTVQRGNIDQIGGDA